MFLIYSNVNPLKVLKDRSATCRKYGNCSLDYSGKQFDLFRVNDMKLKLRLVENTHHSKTEMS